MICSKGRIGILAAVASMAFLGACTQVNDMLGNGLIPDDQQMQTREVVLGANPSEPVYFETRLLQEDNIPSNDWVFLTLGAKYSPVFGYTTASGVVQPVPAITPSEDNYYGTKPAIDSLYLYLSVDSHSGKTDVEQGFTIYELNKDTIDRSSSYYADFDVQRCYDNAKPLFRFKLKGTDNYYYKKLEVVEPYGRQYLERLIATGSKFTNDSTFIHAKGFPGIYIAPDVAQTDAAIYRMMTDYTKHRSALYLFTHNYTDQTATQVADTMATAYAFADYQASQDYYSGSYVYSYTYPMNINCVARNYAAGSVNAWLNNRTLAPTAYVEGLNGVYTELTLTDALRTKIDQLRGGKSVAVNNATIYFELQNPSVDAMNRAFTGLGMFLEYGDMKTFAPDYTGTSYGGQLNRSSGSYEMNITSQVQKMLKDHTAHNTVSLTPQAATDPATDYVFSLAETALKGSAAPGYRIKLKLTYTLIP